MRTLVARLALASALLFAAPAVASAGEWLAGDLHVHTTYSHDSYGGPGDDNTGIDEVNTLGFPVIGEFLLAKTRGLDYLAITDHNDVRSQTDPGFGAFGVIGLPSYENSLDGHAQMHGATHVFPKVDSSSAAAVQALANALRAEGGVFQINHPADSTTDDPDDLDWGLGYGVAPDTVEAWNGPRLYQPPFPASNSHDDAIRYWEGWLDRGVHATLTGGSDSHWIATAAAQGAGQPTTWIYAQTRTVKGLLDGLRAGHTFVSHQPPNYLGPRIYLEADRDGNGTFESIMGDTVPPGSMLRVRVSGGLGLLLRGFTNGGRQNLGPILVTSNNFVYRFHAPAGSTWVRAELAQMDAVKQRRDLLCPRLSSYCRNRLLVFAMTSALYLG